MIENLTWKCHICGEERPDNKISVVTYPLKNLEGAERNLRYCNDKKECIDKAFNKANTKEL